MTTTEEIPIAHKLSEGALMIEYARRLEAHHDGDDQSLARLAATIRNCLEFERVVQGAGSWRTLQGSRDEGTVEPSGKPGCAGGR